MYPTRYLAIIYLQSPASRKRSATSTDGALLVNHVRKIYPEAEAVFTHEHAVIFGIVDQAPATEVFTKLGRGLRKADRLTITEVGQIETNHPGFTEWQARTNWQVKTASSGSL
jgi:hypothetical protein